MSWEKFTSLDGTYLVDLSAVGRMIRSFVRSKAIRANTKVNVESHWIGPNLHTIDVNWDAVARQTNAESEPLLAQLFRTAQFSTQNAISCLAHWVDATNHNNAAFHKQMHDAQKKTMDNIEKSVGRAQIGLSVARNVRDGSAEFLMVSASAVAVPVGVAAILGGAGLKATARAQDDAKASKGAIAATFATEFVFGLVDLGGDKAIESIAKRAGEAAFKETAKELERKAAEKGMRLMLGVLWNNAKLGIEPAKAVLEGKTLKDGLLSGGVKTVAGMHEKILADMIDKDDEFPMLAAIAHTTASIATDLAADAIAEAGKGDGKGERAKTDIPKIIKPTQRAPVLLDALAYDRRLIEKMAIRKLGPAGRVANPVTSFPHVRVAAGFRR